MSKQDDPLYKAAKKRVQQLKEFYEHLVAYVLVNLFLFVIDIRDGGADFFYFVLLGWGIGIGIHAFETFVTSRDWEERKIRELMGEKPKRQSDESYFVDSQ